MRSLGDLLEIVSDLAEEAEGARGEVTRSGEISDEKKGVKAAYGFSVRVGGGGEPPPRRTEGTERTTREDRGLVVEERRDPVVDVFDEGDHLLVVAELPGVTAQDIHVDVKGDVLTLWVDRGDRSYKKEIRLPAAGLFEGAASSYRGGVFELRLSKAR